MPSTTTDRIDGLTTSVAVKAPCRTATTLAIGLSGLQTVGGIALVDGDRVLVKDQADTTQNGIYVARTTAWERARDFDGSRDIVNGTLVVVLSSGNDILFKAGSASSPIVVGSSSITFTQAAFGGASTISFTQFGTGAVVRDLQTKMREEFSVKDFGATGDGVTDDTAAFTLAIAALVLRGGGRLFAPRGTYKVTSAIDLSALRVFEFYGEGASHGVSGQGTFITGSFVGDVVKFTPAGLGVSFKIHSMYIEQNSTNASANAVHVNNFVGGTIEDCYIRCRGNAGIWADSNTFTFNVRRCILVGFQASSPNCIGIYSGSHTLIDNCDITSWGEGVRASGAGVDVKRCRIEVNKKGLHLGVYNDGTTFTLSNSKISGNTFEANDIAIKMVNCTACVFDGVSLFGSFNAPSGQSQIGVWTQQVQACAFTGWTVYGTFSDSSIKMQGGSGIAFSAKDIVASNAYGGYSRVWDVMTGLGNLGSITFTDTNYTVRPGDTVVGGQSHRHGMFQYLSQVDYINNNVEGKNLRGKAVAVGAAGVATKAVAFTGTAHNTAFAAINTATATNTGGATLAAGTYYYAATCVTAHGECTATSEKTVVIGGANNSTTIVFFANTQDGFKRRIYRGTSPGVYDGYWESTLDSNANFVDIGQAFDGNKSPPIGTDDTAMHEPDNNYAVFVMPTWGTSVAVASTNKSTSGFTVSFGTVTPSSNEKIDWFLVR